MRGVPLEYSTLMRYVVNMDLLSNNLVGEIPEGFTGLLGLNLSNNHLTGPLQIILHLVVQFFSEFFVSLYYVF